MDLCFTQFLLGNGIDNMRQAHIERQTNETNISVRLNLDGSGNYENQSGIGFLDHMLDQLARHGKMDIATYCDGDLHIDAHHSTEDIGIAMGLAFRQALGDKKGITRYADCYLPMDEAMTRAAVDISGRPFLVWKVEFSRDKVGDFDTELFQEWFQAFTMNAGITLHIENLYGTNNHHIAESCFKALARVLRQAVRIDVERKDQLPTTKGAL